MQTFIGIFNSLVLAACVHFSSSYIEGSLSAQIQEKYHCIRCNGDA